MQRKNKSEIELKPYWYHEHIFIYDELQFKNDTIKVGDELKFKNARGSFKFIRFAHNSQKDVSWIDCVESKTGVYRSFYIDQLATVVRAKKSRRKKQLV